MSHTTCDRSEACKPTAPPPVTAGAADTRRMIRTELPHKRLCTPRGAVNGNFGSDGSDGSDGGKFPQQKSGRLSPLWRVTFRPVNGEVPDAIRMRLLLKDVGRRQGLECVDVREETQPPAGPAGA